MKKSLALLVAPATLAICLSGAAPAAAAAPGGYGSQPGFEVAMSNTECAGHGAFGAFGGKDDNFKGGANGTQTGINNSSLCGNPQR